THLTTLVAKHLSFPGDDTHPDLHSFPTRRSSDLPEGESGAGQNAVAIVNGEPISAEAFNRELARFEAGRAALGYEVSDQGSYRRSEEHTSELKSREKLVCRLLLENKKHRSVQKYT